MDGHLVWYQYALTDHVLTTFIRRTFTGHVVSKRSCLDLYPYLCRQNGECIAFIEALSDTMDIVSVVISTSPI